MIHRFNLLKSSRIRLALLILLGVCLAVLFAFFITRGLWPIIPALIVMLPLTILLIKRPFAGVILWLFLMPFYLAFPNSSLAYWVIYRLLLVVLLCLAGLSSKQRGRDHLPVRLGPPELAMGILVLYVPAFIVLFQNAPSLALTRFSDRMLLPFCIYLAIRLMTPRGKEIKQLQWVALFIALSQSFIGFLSWVAPQVLPGEWQYLNGSRTTGSMVDPDLYALLLSFSVVILVHGAVDQKSRLIRFIFLFSASLCAIFVFLSLERAAWLGGIFLIIGLVMLYPKMMVRLGIIGTIVMAILGTGILSTHVALSVDRFSASNPIYDRIVIFDAMFQMVQEKPILGWGYETLDQNIQYYFRRVGEASISRLVTSHNTYLTVLTELGLVGFILYMFPVFWWLVLSFRVWPRIPKEGLWNRSLLAVFWLVMLFNFTVCNFMDMRWFPTGLALWWMVLGLIANMVYPYLKGRGGYLPEQAVLAKKYE